jgi:transketolase N-terminal domain/subunit
MAHAGYFPVEELATLRKFGSRLQGHPHRTALPGIETSSGPLGSGLSQAVGMAIAERMDNPYTSKFVYCITGDGELNEGQIWEAAMLAGKEQLHNLIVIVDRNGIQIDGYTKDIMPLELLILTCKKSMVTTFVWLMTLSVKLKVSMGNHQSLLLIRYLQKELMCLSVTSAGTVILLAKDRKIEFLKVSRQK